MRVLSLFDGVSCGRIALQRAGVRVSDYRASEIDTTAIQISQRHWPDIQQIGDVCQVSAVGTVDLLLGGSPCQSFSRSGSRQGFNDARGELFWQFVRILEISNPTYWLFENVCMSSAHESIINAQLGCSPWRLNSGIASAQNRTRLYWTNIPAHDIIDRGLYLRDVLDPVVDPRLQVSGDFTTRKFAAIRTPNQKARALTRSAHIAGTNGCTIINRDGFFYLMSCAEAERLQTLPVGYTAGHSRAKRFAAIGNGWTVDVIVEILKGIHV